MMAPNKNQKTKGNSRPQHLFKGIRDPVVINASIGNTPSMISLTTDSNGNAAELISFSPFGFSGLGVTSATAGQPATFTTVPYQSPALPWLYNQARNFERYRVLRAVLIAVGNLGSSATGRLLLDSSTDAADNASVITTATSTGGKVYDIGSLATKEARFQVDIDSSWKKCSSRTNLVSSNGLSCLPVSTVNDLLFTNVYIACNGVSASAAAPTAGTIVAQFYMEYDVEFRDPISYGVNV